MAYTPQYTIVQTGFITDRSTGESVGVTVSSTPTTKWWIERVEFKEDMRHLQKLEHRMYSEKSSATPKHEIKMKLFLRTNLVHLPEIER